MFPPRTLLDVLRRRREQDTMTVGFFDRKTSAFDISTVGTYLDCCSTTSWAMLDAGVTDGRTAMVVGASPRALLTGYLAAVVAGAVPVLLPLRPSFDRAEDIERRLALAERQLPDAALFVQTVDGRPCVAPGSRPWTALPIVDEGSGRLDELLDARSSVPSDRLHLQLTSGSTGDFRPVVLTNGNIMASTAASVDGIGLEPDDHCVSWLPLYHDMGLVGMALVALVGGAHLRLLSPFDFLADPMSWLAAVADSPGAVTAAPNFAFDYAQRRARTTEPPLDLSGWKKCYCGAEPVDSRTIAAFVDRFRPLGLRPEVVHPTYGLAEATLLVTMPQTGERPKQATISMVACAGHGRIDLRSIGPMEGFEPADDPETTSVACLGRPAGVTVEIIDDAGCIVDAEDVCGEVVVAGPAVSPGYLLPDGSIEAFEGGRCRTGDIGFLNDGELYLVERIQNIIIRGGHNHSATAFERRVAHVLDLPLDRVAVLQESISSDAVVAVVEAERRVDVEELVAALRSVVGELGLPIDEMLVVARNAIPQTTSGKKQHVDLRFGLRAGTVPVLERIAVGPSVTPAPLVIDLDALAIGDRIMALTERHARSRGWGGEAISEGCRFGSDLLFDSVAMIELLVDVEAELDVGLPEAKFGELDSVGDLIALAGDPVPREGGIGSAVERLRTGIPQVYRIVDEQRARVLAIDGRTIVDFASVNYLGFDLHPDVVASVGPAVERWGVHPSWTRAVASPTPYAELETELAALVGVPDAMVFSTVTLIHLGLLPLLATAADSVIFDLGSHNSLREGVELAVARGATLRLFDHRDLTTLIEAMAEAPGRPIVALNGVYSMTGTIADLVQICRMVEERDGLVYIDDAHGFGILGEPTGPLDPYGSGGGGVVAHLGLDPRRVVYVGGLSKAFSSMAAFVSCRDGEQRRLFELASTSIYSGPIPTASLASALAGLRVNRAEGDAIRRRLHRLTSRLIGGLLDRGHEIENPLAFPIVNIAAGAVDRTVRAAEIMWREGILFTPAVFPAAPFDRGGFRLSVTAANTEDEVDQVLAALDAVERELGPLPLSGSPTRSVVG